MNQRTRRSFAAILLFACIAGCNSKQPTQPSESLRIESITMSGHLSGTPGSKDFSTGPRQTIRMDCQAVGSPELPLDYFWETNVGRFDHNDRQTVMWTSPDTGAIVQISVTVSNGIESVRKVAPRLPVLVIDGVKLHEPAEGAIMDNGCEDRSDGIVWDFSWFPLPGATRYHLYVKGANAIYPAIDNPMILDTAYHDVSPESYIVSSNQFGWIWRVRALVNGVWTDWSPERTFDAEPLNTDCVNTQKRILVDASGDGGGWWFPQSEPTGFDATKPHQGKALADLMRSRGFQVDELPRGVQITDSLLHRYDKVIRVGSSVSYDSESELAAYESFLARSTSLLLISEYLRPGQHDRLAERLGLTFAGVAYGDVTKYATHPITQGATSFYYNAGAVVMNADGNPNIQVLGWLSESSYADLNDNRVQDPGEPTGPPVMGILHHPTARIFFLGEINGLQTVPQPLVNNLLDWAFQ